MDERVAVNIGEGEEPAAFPIRLGSVDIGSNALRVLAAEFTARERFTPLHAERRPVRLGHDVFLSGRLTEEAMHAAVGALQSFREVLETQGVHRYRAVATSAVRESDNGEAFVARIRAEAGLEVEVISGSEEARLAHLAVRQRLPLGDRPWLLADLGGGSVEVSLVDRSGIRWSQSHSMGAVRLLEELAGAGEEPGRFRRLLGGYIATLRLPAPAQYHPPAGFIATGGNIEALARLALPEADPAAVLQLPLSTLQRTIDSLTHLPYRERVRRLGLREDRADVILPAAMVYEHLARLAGAPVVWVPGVGIREGVVLDLMERLAGRRAHETHQERSTRDAALALGRRYMFDEPHAVKVAELALTLFDELAELGLHSLDGEARRVLLAAALLHDIGGYVSFKGHHKHSLYLIGHSELPAFSPRAMQVVANVARYHRKADPSTGHETFAALSEPDRETVTRLAAILRLADALDREHLQKVVRVHLRRGGGQLTLHYHAGGDLLLEQWALRKKAALFQRVFGLTVRFNQHPI